MSNDEFPDPTPASSPKLLLPLPAASQMVIVINDVLIQQVDELLIVAEPDYIAQVAEVNRPSANQG